MPTSRAKGVFCLETDWWGVKDSTTVEPVLQLLQQHADSRVPYIHRDVGTREELDYYLAKWCQRGLAQYPILYLALHGDQEQVWMGDGRRKNSVVTLEHLAEALEGKCKGRLIHFGSCGTLGIDGRKLTTFLKRTGAVAISGYRKDVDWFDSTAFETLLLGRLQDRAFTKPGMAALLRQLKADAGGLARRLGYRLHVRP